MLLGWSVSFLVRLIYIISKYVECNLRSAHANPWSKGSISNSLFDLIISIRVLFYFFHLTVNKIYHKKYHLQRGQASKGCLFHASVFFFSNFPMILIFCKKARQELLTISFLTFPHFLFLSYGFFLILLSSSLEIAHYKKLRVLFLYNLIKASRSNGFFNSIKKTIKFILFLSNQLLWWYFIKQTEYILCY